MINIKCPVCHCEIQINDRIHIMDEVIRTEYCDICDSILEIKNGKVVRPTVNELLGILGE